MFKPETKKIKGQIRKKKLMAASCFIFLFSYLLILLTSSLSYAGVGGGVEAKEFVDIASVLKFSAIFLLGIGALFGLGLAFAAKKFDVKTDPRVEEILEVLAHAHCGACGYPGCRQYAEAVISNPDVPPNLCTPGGAPCAKAVAEISGKAAEITEPKIARVLCNGDASKSSRRFQYEGIRDCKAAVLASGGDKSCVYGCLGYGTCFRACPFGAINMSEENLPIINPVKCTACGKCAKACPKQIISILPLSKEVLVTCRSKDKGADTKRNCRVGCIGCGMCVKVCPYDAPAITNNLSVIDIDKCKVCGLCVIKCPTDAIVDNLPFRPKALINEKCIGCGICAKVCPVNAASGEPKKLHVIDQEKCIGCGICTSKCPSLAIEGTINYAEIALAFEAKKAAREKAKAEKVQAETAGA
ncbi:MAG: Fe-S cluster domain-containing protein [Thermodesulfovibrionia bacterium]|nr:Fe-S cluster domain-containing protein [Thermodesulfovibrionia bacterium]